MRVVLGVAVHSVAAPALPAHSTEWLCAGARRGGHTGQERRRTFSNRLAATVLVFACLTVLSACGTASVSAPDPLVLECRTAAPCVEFASFETGLGGWAPRVADAGPSTIQRSTERARDGHWSIELSGSNTTDFTKLWLQRTLSVQPNTVYTVQLEYALCCVSYELSEPNAFFYVADARAQQVSANDPPFEFYLWNTVPDDSSAVAVPGSKELWRHKRFSLTARSGPDGRLYVSAGLRYAFESTFRYFIDNVRVTITSQ